MKDLNTKKYKVSINDITPKTALITSKELSSCFIGVSMDNPNFNIKYLPSIIEWVQKNFEHCSIIIADFLDRHSLQISQGIKETEAITKVLKNGEKTFYEYEKLIPSNNQFNIYRWQQVPVAITDEYLTHFSDMLHLHTEVLRDINDDALAYLKRKSLVTDSKSIEEKLKLCSNYIIEEMAFINHQVEMGTYCSVYPGTQLSVLKNFSLNKYPNCNVALNKVVYFDLKLKK